MKTKHVLKMSCGVTVEAEFDQETAEFSCEWSGKRPPWSRSLLRRIKKEYEPWRDQIFADFSRRTGKKVLMITL